MSEVERARERMNEFMERLTRYQLEMGCWRWCYGSDDDLQTLWPEWLVENG